MAPVPHRIIKNLRAQPGKLHLLEELGAGAEEPGELGTGVEERAVAHTWLGGDGRLEGGLVSGV